MVLHWDYITVPLFWDEIHYGGNGIDLMLEGPGHLLRFEAHSYNPPMFQIISAMFLWVFEALSLSISYATLLRILSLGLCGLHLIFIFKIGRFLNLNKLSYLAPVMLLSLPLQYAHVSMVIIDNVLSLFLCAHIYYFLKEKHNQSLILGIVAGLTRPSGIITIGFTLPYLILSKCKDVKKYIIAFSPLVSFGLFCSIQLIFSDLKKHIHVANNWIALDLNLFTDLFWFQFKRVFLYYCHDVLTYIFLFSIVIFAIRSKEKKIQQVHLKFILSTLCMAFVLICAYSFHKMALPRYFLNIESFLVLGSVILYSYFRNGSVVCVILFSYLILRQDAAVVRKTMRDTFEISTYYFDVVKFHQKSIRELEGKYGLGQPIFTSWPYHTLLSDPRYEYVYRPHEVGLNIENSKYFFWSNRINFEFNTPELRDEFVRKHNLVLLEELKSEGSEVRLYAK